MLPFLDQTYEAAQAAKALAKGIGKAQVAPLHLGIASSVETDGLHAVLSEVASGLSGFALSMTDGSSEKLLELAFKGDLDLIMIEAPAGEHDRLNTWPLFVQRYRFFARGDHRLADRLDASIVDLAEESWIDCGTESVARLRAAAEAAGIEISFRHKVSGPGQIERLLLAGLGCTLLPKPMSLDDRLCSVALIDDGLIAPVILAGIAGRQRSPAADAFIRAARARSWPDR